MIYLVIRCPKCEQIGTGQTNKTQGYDYKCRYCFKFTSYKTILSGVNGILATSNSPGFISDLCIKYKEELRKNKRG